MRDAVGLGGEEIGPTCVCRAVDNTSFCGFVAVTFPVAGNVRGHVTCVCMRAMKGCKKSP